MRKPLVILKPFYGSSLIVPMPGSIWNWRGRPGAVTDHIQTGNQGKVVMNRWIRNKIIDKGADIITKTTGEILNENTARQVNEITNITAETLKSGKTTDLIAVAAKKGLEMTKDKKS